MNENITKSYITGHRIRLHFRTQQQTIFSTSILPRGATDSESSRMAFDTAKEERGKIK